MFKNNLFNLDADKALRWVKAASVRAIKTMAQVAGTMLVIGAFKETPWMLMIQTTIMTGFASILTSIVGIPEVTEE